MKEGVLPYIKLDNGWKSWIVNRAITDKEPMIENNSHVKIEHALKNLRKQHLWGDITDEEYQQE
jgi:hypothetical protein